MGFKVRKTIKKILKPKHTHKFTPSYRRPDIPTTPVKPRWHLTH